MAARIARSLAGEVDVVLVRKLRAPAQPEVAVGAVDEQGRTYVAPYAGRFGADEEYLAEERDRQLELIRSRRHRYTPGRAPLDPTARVVVVVDDGMATGSTMLAALHTLQNHHPALIVCAVPVASEDALALVRDQADEVVCLETPHHFAAVGNFYRDFGEVTDDEVVAALNGATAGGEGRG